MSPIFEINERVREESYFIDIVIRELEKSIIGQKALLERLLIGLLSNGHVILEGAPGLAKTLAIKTLAGLVKADFARIQFTPDLLPGDITGSVIYSPKSETFSTRKGPIFANFVLADEINRSPAKVQSALLEAMQERQTTIGDKTFQLPNPFFILATQNPIEQEGVYPLPEAQIDRFLMKVKISYPKKEEERQIIRSNMSLTARNIEPVVTIEQILRGQELVREVYMDEKIEKYIVDIVFATRNPEEYNLSELKPLIEYGASPRGSINLAIASKARAFIKRRGYVLPEDVRDIAFDVLRHRFGLSFEAEAENITTDEIIKRILDKLPTP